MKNQCHYGRGQRDTERRNEKKIERGAAAAAVRREKSARCVCVREFAHWCGY